MQCVDYGDVGAFVHSVLQVTARMTLNQIKATKELGSQKAFLAYRSAWKTAGSCFGTGMLAPGLH